MSEQVVEQITKQWTTAAIFHTFEEADTERKELSKINELVKVKMGNKGKVFRVKIWNTPTNKNLTNKKSKGKKKNENKKIRTRQTSE